MTYFRLWDEGDDPARLLDPAEQLSTPWGEPDHGPCDKCRGSGEAPWRCLSCVAGCQPDCECCGGRVSFVDRCPACEGTGEISRTRREGVSVFPTELGLYAYFLERDAQLTGKTMVELDGPLSGDVDLDADAGALLVRPERIVEARPIDPALVSRARELVCLVEGGEPSAKR